MNVNYPAVFIAILLTFTGFAQQQDILPYSMRLGMDHSKVPISFAAPFDADAAHEDDLRRAEAGELPLYGRMVHVGATLNGNGLWTTLPNGDRIWRLKVYSEGALATDLFFDDFHLPPGALFHVYEPAGAEMHGAFTDHDVQAHGQFTTDMIFGEYCMIEYFEPYAVRGEGRFILTELSHAYRLVGAAAVSDPCQVDVNCPEGEGWHEQRDSVVRIRVVVPEGTGWCTGVVMNNTQRNCAPFVLTALHCGTTSTAANFNQYIFRFRYQRGGCGTGITPLGSQMTGCTKRADSNDNGGSSGSDFMLLELNALIPSNYQPYYAGWNAENQPVLSGTSIHHPSSDVKKISTFTNALQTSGWGISNTHWRVVWSPTETGAGVTEPGSSGSPIFDQHRRVVGTLTGGASCCELNGCGSFTGPNQPDYYGKMSHHWNGNPNATSQKLRNWLNPGGGITVLDGSYYPCAPVGIDDKEQDQQLEIYPNPSADRFTVQYPEGVVRAELVEVTDLSGRLIYSESPLTSGKAIIDASAWSSGTYLVSVVVDGIRHAGAKVMVGGR